MTNDDLDKKISDKLNKAELPHSAEEEWLAFSSKVSRNNFLSFGFKHFNIYYAGLILLLILLLIFLWPDKNSQGTTTPVQKNNVIVNDTSATQIKNNIAEPENSSSNENIPFRKKADAKKSSGNLPDVAQKDTVYSQKPDSSLTAPKVQAPDTVKPAKRQVRIMNVISRDTIFKKDTVMVKGRKKKK